MNRRVLTCAAVVMLALSGCRPASEVATGASRSPEANADSYAHCLQDHGLVLEQYTAEDGSTRSRPDKNHNDPQAVSDAVGACASLLPVDEGSTSRPTEQDIEARRHYAACIRDHGVADFPDPDPATGEFHMDDATQARIKQDPTMRTAMEACRSMLPGGTDAGVVGG